MKVGRRLGFGLVWLRVRLGLKLRLGLGMRLGLGAPLELDALSFNLREISTTVVKDDQMSMKLLTFQTPITAGWCSATNRPGDNAWTQISGKGSSKWPGGGSGRWDVTVDAGWGRRPRVTSATKRQGEVAFQEVANGEIRRFQEFLQWLIENGRVENWLIEALDEARFWLEEGGHSPLSG